MTAEQLDYSNDGSWIPNIEMGKDYDGKYADALIHYDSLEAFAGFFARDMPVHRHVQHLQIHYMDGGETQFHIDDRIYSVSGACCFFTPPSVPHSFRTQEGTTGHVLTINQSLVWQLLDEGLHQEGGIDLSDGICLGATSLQDGCNHQQWTTIGQLFRTIGLEWVSRIPAKPIMLEHLCKALVLQIARLGSNPSPSTNASNESLIIFRKFTDLIECSYKQHLALPEYCKQLGLPERRLNQICRQIANQSPKSLVVDRLVQEAKRLLIHSTATSKEICYQLGFNDPAYFCRFFRKHTAMTTQAYRKLGPTK